MKYNLIGTNDDWNTQLPIMTTDNPVAIRQAYDASVIDVVIVDEDGQVVDPSTLAEVNSRGYSFKRVQCITRVHPDDKAKVQALAAQLNKQREARP